MINAEGNRLSLSGPLTIATVAEVVEEGRKCDVLIHAESKDRGRIIGKSGRMISSLRTLCQAAGEKTGQRVNLEIFEEEAERRAHRPERPHAEAL